MIFIPVLACLVLAITTALVTRAWLKTRTQLQHYQPIIDLEAECSRLREEAERDVLAMATQRDQLAANAEREVLAMNTQRQQLTTDIAQKRARWEQDYAGALAELQTLTHQIEIYRDEAEMQEHGLYRPIFDYDTPERFKQAIKDVRDQQKALIKAKTAAVCQTEWSVEGSKAKGRKMTDRNLKLMLRAFNGEADACIASVKAGKVTTMLERLQRAFDAINKLSEANHCTIVPDYLALKTTELRLTHELAEKIQDEKERQREIREQMREEERARREADKAEKEAEREEARAQSALDAARAELAAASAASLDAARAELSAANVAQQAELAGRIAELEASLAEAHANKERALSMAQQTRRGHVYVISNEGSFGREVYKIGMTRRLDPMDRVKELGDASVPFTFDVHAMIFSDDAPALEAQLHAIFDARRLNLVNTRKEFFRVSLSEIEAVVGQHCAGEVEFVRVAEAEEFHATRAMRAEREAEREGRRVADAADKLVDDARRHFEQARQRLATVD